MFTREQVSELQRDLLKGGWYRGDIDGLRGPATNDALLSYTMHVHGIKPQQIHFGQLSEKVESFVIGLEVDGKTGYNSKYHQPLWPEFESGITIGIGYDIGYVTAEEFDRDWAALYPSAKGKLQTVIGYKGHGAKLALPYVTNLSISWDIALSVFRSATVPKFWKETLRAFPGADQLPADAFGALWSLVYNRGASLKGENRLEMRTIAGLVQLKDLKGIANQLRAMKRVWIGTSIQNGMAKRREAEARLVEGCIV